MRIMGLDVGEKRIGIAISDPMGWTAQGHSVLARNQDKQVFIAIKKISEEYDLDEIVLGLPLNMDGTEGFKAEEIREFAQGLQKYVKCLVNFWDERMTTVSAARTLIEGDVSRKKRKNLVDKVAAVYILQAYLDRLNRSNSIQDR